MKRRTAAVWAQEVVVVGLLELVAEAPVRPQATRVDVLAPGTPPRLPDARRAHPLAHALVVEDGPAVLARPTD